MMMGHIFRLIFDVYISVLKQLDGEQPGIRLLRKAAR